MVPKSVINTLFWVSFLNIISFLLSHLECYKQVMWFSFGIFDKYCVPRCEINHMCSSKEKKNQYRVGFFTKCASCQLKYPGPMWPSLKTTSGFCLQRLANTELGKQVMTQKIGIQPYMWKTQTKFLNLNSKLWPWSVPVVHM